MPSTRTIDHNQAAKLLEQFETTSVTHVDGATATTLRSPTGQVVLVQGSGDKFLLIE